MFGWLKYFKRDTYINGHDVDAVVNISGNNQIKQTSRVRPPTAPYVDPGSRGLRTARRRWRMDSTDTALSSSPTQVAEAVSKWWVIVRSFSVCRSDSRSTSQSVAISGGYCQSGCVLVRAVTSIVSLSFRLLRTVRLRSPPPADIRQSTVNGYRTVVHESHSITRAILASG